MQRSLYVFVDESGNVSSDEYYVVAGSWCISTQSNTSRILEPTVGSLRSTANAARERSGAISELKGSQLHPDVLGDVLSCLEQSPPYEDSSIEQQRLPWVISYPIRFTLHDMNPNLGIDVLEEILDGSTRFDAGTASHPVALQTLALATILNPVFQSSFLDLSQITEVNVVLDAEVWETPVEHLKECLDTVSELQSPMAFETRDSEKTPGVQIADLAAYSWGRHLRRGDCGKGVAHIDRLRMADQ